MKKEKKKRRTLYQLIFKRFFDFVLSLLAIVILSPVFLIVWICSKISIGGKAIFAQYRPGKNGKVFKLYKFRSMTNKTDENGNLLPDSERITKFGKIIRKLSLDELPQLFNILKGDMSIVGPRPRLVKDMIFYDEEVMKAYSVRPGLTGPAQVYDRNSELSWESVFARDLEYAERVTFFKDLKLFFGTFVAVFKGGSASGANSESNLQKREYYYSDHLLKSGKITQEQYDNGLSLADKLISEKGQVKFNQELHN
ncbi:MAG: sugar transferase [Clostridia bacterium]|nr:sugar transferase [Clostridia bacterium]